MARTHAQPTPNVSRSLVAYRRKCVGCGGPLWSGYWQQRSILTLAGWVRLRLQIRRCCTYGCALFGRPYRPEEEGGSAEILSIVVDWPVVITRRTAGLRAQ